MFVHCLEPDWAITVETGARTQTLNNHLVPVCAADFQHPYILTHLYPSDPLRFGVSESRLMVVAALAHAVCYYLVVEPTHESSPLITTFYYLQLDTVRLKNIRSHLGHRNWIHFRKDW